MNSENRRLLGLGGVGDRRAFFQRAGVGIAALASLLGEDGVRGEAVEETARLPHFRPRVRRVIYLFQSGAPSQLELFDYKPGLANWRGADLPESVRRGQRLTGMTASQERFPVVATRYGFRRWGQSGQWISELLPHTAGWADRMCVIQSMHTEAINHDPAITFLQTGAQLAGRPSVGSWIQYGLGSLNRDLPAFVALVSGEGDQPLYERLWGSGFLPTQYQGVRFRSGREPVLFLENPPGIRTEARRRMLDDLAELNGMRLAASGDPEIGARVAQYELAFRMQASAPELTDLSGEPESVRERYGPGVKRPGSYAFNCLLARRMCERGVRFVQLFHRGWDHHTNLPASMEKVCRETDQPTAALLRDLEERGLMDDTLVVWGGEFGRTVYCQGKLTAENYGRDHHPRCFTMWMAGAGVKAGLRYGETDEFSYNIVRDPVHVHDLHATLMHLLGMDHTRLTYKFQGRNYRLTDVHGEVVRACLSDG